MNPEIKQRLDQIRRGEVPEGYKKTKAGIVPVEWDVVKAKEIFANISNKKHNGKLEVLSVTQDRGIIPRSEVDIDIKYGKESTGNYKKVEKGNFVISLRSFQGGIEYSEYEGIVSPAYTVLSSKVDICDSYYKSFLKSPEYIQRLNTAVYGIRDGKNISYDDFSLIYIPFPPLPEQQKIAEILTMQDKLIELQARKIEQLQALKKACLQRMFPKKGCDRPEIRFPEFTDAWEQRKLGDVGSCQSGIGFPDVEQGGAEGIPFFKVSDMNLSGNEYELLSSNNYVSQEQIERKKWKPITQVPAMFFAKVGAAVMLNRKRFVNTPFLLDNNTMAYIFGEGWDTNFGRTLFDTINLTSLVQVGALPSYNAGDVEVLEISLPSIEEQQAIGNYFKSLDHLITLHQRKLDEEKQKKKALMQLLLTGIVRVKI